MVRDADALRLVELQAWRVGGDGGADAKLRCEACEAFAQRGSKVSGRDNWSAETQS